MLPAGTCRKRLRKAASGEAVEQIRALNAELGHGSSAPPHCSFLKVTGGPVPKTFKVTLRQSLL